MMNVTESSLREGLAASLNVNRWIDEVASRAPFASAAELLAVAAEAATPLSPAEIDEAIAHHPRIGDQLGSRVERDGDRDGRVSELGPESLPVGGYRVVFETGVYFAASGTDTFYPRVSIDFEIADASAHYHVPLLLSPFAFSTYRGS
jgi:5-hydroxyisourate hydrolase